MSLKYKEAEKENSMSSMNSENSLDELIEQKIYDWLDKNGIYMDSPTSKVSNKIRSQNTSPMQLSSNLFMRRTLSHMEKNNKF